MILAVSRFYWRVAIARAENAQYFIQRGSYKRNRGREREQEEAREGREKREREGGEQGESIGMNADGSVAFR